jgi:hypothetical protein
VGVLVRLNDNEVNLVKDVVDLVDAGVVVVVVVVVVEVVFEVAIPPDLQFTLLGQLQTLKS